MYPQDYQPEHERSRPRLPYHQRDGYYPPRGGRRGYASNNYRFIPRGGRPTYQLAYHPMYAQYDRGYRQWPEGNWHRQRRRASRSQSPPRARYHPQRPRSYMEHRHPHHGAPAIEDRAYDSARSYIADGNSISSDERFEMASRSRRYSRMGPSADDPLRLNTGRIRYHRPDRDSSDAQSAVQRDSDASDSDDIEGSIANMLQRT